MFKLKGLDGGMDRPTEGVLNGERRARAAAWEEPTAGAVQFR